MKRKRICWILAVFLGLTALGTLAYFGSKDRDVALAELEVENLTCASCIKKIEKALDKVPGMENIEVNLTSGRVKAEFEPEKTDAEVLARTLSEAGYPAVVRQVLSPADYLNLRQDAGRLAATHVGRIGDRLISREDFDLELARMKDSSAIPSGAEGTALQRNAWLSLQQRMTLLAEAERLNVLIQDGEVDVMADKMREAMPGFDNLVAEQFGSEREFLSRLKEDLIIRRLVDEQVPGREEEEGLRQARLNEWYRELVARTTVEVFDPGLRTALQSGGGSCCPSQ